MTLHDAPADAAVPVSANRPAGLRRRALLAAPLLLGARPCRAQAQAQSGRPIRIVVSFAAGGEPDILGRRLATALEQHLRQPVVVDNRPGGNTVIAANHVAQSHPDGETIFLTSSTTFAAVPHLYATPRVRLDQFEPLTLLMRAQMALYCHPSVPVRSVAELIEYANRQPQPMLYAANPGAIAHLCGEKMKQVTGIRMNDVSYRGTTGAQQLLLRGDVVAGFDGVPAYGELVRTGQVRALGVTGDRRVPMMPDCPTFAEAGYPDIAFPYWYGMFAPAGTPRPATERLVAAIHQAQRDGQLGQQFLDQGAQLEGNSPAEFGAMIARERESWGALIRSIGLRLD